MWWNVRNGFLRNLSKMSAAALSFLAESADTSSVGNPCSADFPMLPRPDCCLLASHRALIPAWMREPWAGRHSVP
jgi:hypothetical protein